MQRLFFVVVVLTAVCGIVPAAEEAIEIKIASNKIGEKARITKIEKTATTVETKVAGRGETKETSSGQKFVFVESILDKPDAKKKATKLTRIYETAEITKQGKTETLSFASKTVSIEKKDGNYHS